MSNPFTVKTSSIRTSRSSLVKKINTSLKEECVYLDKTSHMLKTTFQHKDRFDGINLRLVSMKDQRHHKSSIRRTNNTPFETHPWTTSCFTVKIVLQTRVIQTSDLPFIISLILGMYLRTD